MGNSHPRVIATLDNLGFALSKNKDYQKALSVSHSIQIFVYLLNSCGRLTQL